MFETRCKLCNNIVYQNYKLTTSDKLWYHCKCGCMFNDDYILPENFFNQEYKAKLKTIKSYEDRYNYLIRVYAPLIEEKTYGRTMLDVGFGTEIIMEQMEQRGWITEGIDIIGSERPGTIKADFEHYDFWKQGHDRYDLIWMGDVLQCFNDPVKAIYKAYNLLKPFGILMIITPNTDLIRANRVPMWGHWNMKENRQFINEALLKQILARADESLTGEAKVFYCDPAVFSKRFVTFSNMHLMAQKFKIEEFARMEDINVKTEETTQVSQAKAN